MNMVEERWNGWVTEVEGTIHDIKDHPDNYEGSTVPIKCIRSEKIRHTLKGIHYWRAWLSYMAATMRQHHHKLAFDFALAEMSECLRQRAAEGERVDLGYLLGDGNLPVGADNLHHLFQRLHKPVG